MDKNKVDNKKEENNGYIVMIDENYKPYTVYTKNGKISDVIYRLLKPFKDKQNADDVQSELECDACGHLGGFCSCKEEIDCYEGDENQMSDIIKTFHEVGVFLSKTKVNVYTVIAGEDIKENQRVAMCPKDGKAYALKLRKRGRPRKDEVNRNLLIPICNSTFMGNAKKGEEVYVRECGL